MPKEFPKNNINRKIIYLVIWVIVFIIISVIIMSSNKNDKNVTNNTQINNNIIYEDDEFEIPSQNDELIVYQEAKLKLLNKHFGFKYTFDGQTGKVIYTGTNNNNVISLTREDTSGIQNLYIENDILYKVVLNEKTITDYEINHETYLDIDYVLENINENSIKLNNNIYEFYIFDNQGKIYIVDSNISKIEIFVGIETYTLEFSNIK